jgi:DEAD/DEAH box helicase domain-containing protein
VLDDGVRRLVQSDHLVVRHRGRRNEPMAVWDGVGWPAHGVGLRNAGGAPVRIVERGSERLVGDIDRARAPEQAHPGASYLHQGVHWRVTELDLDVGVATVEPDDGSTYTVARSDTRTHLLGTDAQCLVGAARLSLGPVEVVSQVVGYQRKDTLSRTVVASEPLVMPPSTLPTRAIWYVIDAALAEAAGVEPGLLGSALHAIEHAAIGMLPLFAICDRWDVGGVSIARHPDTALPTIVIYDAVPGGAGVADLAFEAADRHLRATLETISACGCRDGCPSCVQSPKCGNANEHLDKAAARSLLETILG